jgi:hypothetical protein
MGAVFELVVVLVIITAAVLINLFTLFIGPKVALIPPGAGAVCLRAGPWGSGVRL